MSWVRPLRITTPDGDTIHGAQWPDGRTFVWPPDDLAEAWMTPAAAAQAAADRHWTIEWAEASHG